MAADASFDLLRLGSEHTTFLVVAVLTLLVFRHLCELIETSWTFLLEWSLRMHGHWLAFRLNWKRQRVVYLARLDSEKTMAKDGQRGLPQQDRGVFGLSD